MIDKIDLLEKFALFSDTWHPRVITDLNDSYVKLARLSGTFVWHKHDAEDELFVIVKGSLLMKFRDHDVTVNEGEILVVPKGVEHCPVAAEEVFVMLIEPKVTLHTGDVQIDQTVAIEDQIRI